MPDLHSLSLSGPFATYQVPFTSFLLDRGHKRASATRLLRLLEHFGCWLEQCRRRPQELDHALARAYLDARRADGHIRLISLRALEPILTFLAREGVVSRTALEAPPDPLHLDLLGPYRRWLEHDLRLEANGVVRHLDLARGLLLSSFGKDAPLGSLAASDVLAFIHARREHYSTSTMALDLGALRNLLRYMFVHGLIEHDLRGAVPAIASVRQRTLPTTLDAEQVRRLLCACDRRRRRGRRDYAVLLLMLRLGLRRGDVAALALEDIDWQSGELRVAGKNRREERLPLPGDVGVALAAYLRHARPITDERAVFFTMVAPIRAIRPMTVTALVARACERAQLPSGCVRRLRHTAASLMLDAGASLDEIAQVLRHRSIETTALYAKIDDRALAELVREWPETAR